MKSPLKDLLTGAAFAGLLAGASLSLQGCASPAKGQACSTNPPSNLAGKSGCGGKNGCGGANGCGAPSRAKVCKAKACPSPTPKSS